jgi:colanic acid/amylovoran biosynthesis glycosyltransferase
VRVLFCLHSFPAPSLTFVNNQITGLLDRGFDVRIVSHVPASEALEHEDTKAYDLVARTVYVAPKHAASLFELRKLLPPLARRRPSLRRVAHGLGALGRRAPADSWRLLRRGAAFLQHWPFDVIVSHFGPIGVATQQLRDVGFSSAPMATFFHGYDVSRTVDEEGPDFYRRLFDAGEMLLPISDYWRDKLLRLGAPAARTEVHRMGVDCSKIAFRPRSLSQGEKVRLLSVARLTEKKGIAYALRALVEVKRRFPSFHYDVVGDGSLRESLERLVDELELRPWVTLHGWKSQTQVARLREEAHVLLQPSITASDGDQEGIPVALMEALAAGMPVISTLHTGIPELVEHGRAGFLVPERDSAALAVSLQQLIEAPQRWSEFGRAGRARVEQAFDINVLNEQLVERLHRLAAYRLAAF